MTRVKKRRYIMRIALIELKLMIYINKYTPEKQNIDL